MTDSQNANDESLTAPYVMEFAYTRTLGPVLSDFFTGLRDGKILGIKTQDGRVMVPPQEYDPVTIATFGRCSLCSVIDNPFDVP